jgi:NAD(P)-dependent dehydrogenase (short-subunit alcohol dehydrogenase family)
LGGYRQGLSDHARAEGRKLDILFANAGMGEFAPLGHIDEEHFDKQFDANVKGTLFTVQGAFASDGRGKRDCLERLAGFR